MSYRDKVSGINIIVKNKERLPYGDKDRGKFVPPENGRRAIFVPSWGTMEKQEVEETVMVAQEQEDERIKKNETTQMKENMENLVNAAMRSKRGERHETIEGILKEAQ